MKGLDADLVLSQEQRDVIIDLSVELLPGKQDAEHGAQHLQNRYFDLSRFNQRAEGWQQPSPYSCHLKKVSLTFFFQRTPRHVVPSAPLPLSGTGKQIQDWEKTPKPSFWAPHLGVAIR